MRIVVVVISWIAYKNALSRIKSRPHPPATGHRMCPRMCLCEKFLFTGECNSSINRRFSDIANNYSARCMSRIFPSSFNITCILFCKTKIPLDFIRRSFKSQTLCCTYRLFAASASSTDSTTRQTKTYAILFQSRLRLCKDCYRACNFWAIHATDSVIHFLLQVQTCWLALQCQLNDVCRTRVIIIWLIYNQTSFAKLFDNRQNLVVMIIMTRLAWGLEQSQKIHNFGIGIVPIDIIYSILLSFNIVRDKSTLLFIPVSNFFNLINGAIIFFILVSHYLITRAMIAPASICRQKNDPVDLYVIIRTDTFVGKFQEN